MEDQAGSYAFHRSYHDATRRLPDEMRLQLFDAMNRLAFDGEDTDFQEWELDMAWNLVKPNIMSSVSHSKRTRKSGSKSTAKSGRKPSSESTAKSTGKSTCKSNAESTPHRTERSGVDDEYLSPRKKDIQSSGRSGEADAAVAAPPSLPDGWERTGSVCKPGTCGALRLRDPDGRLWCPNCDEVELRMFGVLGEVAT